MNIRFLEPAQNELDDAFDWYEMEQSGLGRRFLAEIQSALTQIIVFPDSCSVIAALCRNAHLLGNDSYSEEFKGEKLPLLDQVVQFHL